MRKIAIILPFLLSMQTSTIFDFDASSDLTKWIVVDDVVMGGKSSGSIDIDKNGHGVFKGTVSLENNGGFSSLRYRSDRISTNPFTKVVLRVKGDGKVYQFRIRAKSSDYYSYIRKFRTSGKWETIEIPLTEMYPSFRGRTLDIPPYSNQGIEEVAFLIGNKEAEDFVLRIDRIELH